METTLLEDLKKALAVGGELDDDIKDDVMFEMLKFIANDDSCKDGLGEDQLRDAADYAFNVFLVSWMNIVEKVNNEDEFNNKLKKLCLNACQNERRMAHGRIHRTVGIVSI